MRALCKGAADFPPFVVFLAACTFFLGLLINGLLASLRTGLLAGLLAAGLAALVDLAAAGFFAAAGLAAGFVTLEVEAAAAGFFSVFFSAFFSAGLPIIYKNNVK